jgi:hypothetical protein
MIAWKQGHYLLMGACALVCSFAASAHHSFAATYVSDKTVKVEGKIVQFMFRNPHSILQVTGPDADGKVFRWAAEWGGTLDLQNSGVKKDTLMPGDQIIITGYPARNAEDHRIRVVSIERPSDGWKWAGQFR